MYIADLHIHSRFSRATSRDLNAQQLDLWARRKGIGLVGTGDFTHPAWRAELAEMLVPAEDGLYRLKDSLALPGETQVETLPRFVVTGEISTIYKKDGKTRKVHHVILLPSPEAAENLSHRLEAIGNLHSDGRPILGLDSRDLLEITLESCPQAIYIPAHIWTPHFSLFGAFSDFNTVEECFGDLAPYVHALETGLSSDPLMNRRLSMLDGYTLVSNSDAHSAAKLGREANVLDCALNYPSLKQAIETGEGFHGTIEFYPEEGKYHLDGHRNCHCCLEPSETVALDGRCPMCGRKLTVGVLHRVEALADRAEPIALAKPFESLMPLPELLADCMGVSPASKKVNERYFQLLGTLGSEFDILRTLPLDTVENAAGPIVAEALRRLRAGQVIRKAGYDGEYGVISLFEPGEVERLMGQQSLIGLAGLAAKKGFDASAVVRKKAEGKADEAPVIHALNEAQAAAVNTLSRHTAVIAGPGTGKTKTLVSRIACLIETCGVPAAEITAVTFTRQAAHEMQERLTAQLGKKAVRGLHIGTFHAICMELIDPKPVVSHAQAVEILSRLLEEHGEVLSPTECLRMLSLFKNNLCAHQAALPAWLPSAYAQRLEWLGLRDLDDVLLDALQTPVKDKKRFTHLLVDEFQDINAVQHALVAHWSEKSESLFVIGDPDQAIYGFRGAKADCFDAFLSSYPEAQVIRLSRNYRSTPQVIEAALCVIQPNGGERQLTAHAANGVPVRVMDAPDAFSEAVWIAKEIARTTGGTDMLDAQRMENDRNVVRSFSEIAVLCRTHRQLEQIETALAHDSIPCIISGQDGWLDSRMVQGMLGFFASLRDPADSASLQAALEGIWRIPPALAQRAIVALAASQEADALAEELADFPLLAPWVEAVRQLSGKKDKPRKLLEQLAVLCDLDDPNISKLLNAAVFHDDMGDLLAALRTGEEADVRRASGTGYASGAVRLMTLHAAKGLEFPVVFLAGVTAGSLPLERMHNAVDVQEERRLFFVGLTRAREELILTCGGAPSIFLQNLPKSIQRGDIRPRNRMPRMEQLSLF